MNFVFNCLRFVAVCMYSVWILGMFLWVKEYVKNYTASEEYFHFLLTRVSTLGRNRVLVFVLYKKEASRVESMLQRR